MATGKNPKTALARKLDSRFQVDDKPRSLLRAIRLALARSADDLLKLPLAVIGATQRLCSHDALPQAIEEGRLFLLFASQTEVLAAACLDRHCVASIIQQQTLGQLSKGDAEARPYTGTDAAMSAPLIEGTLSRVVGLVDAPVERARVAGFEFLSSLPDRRSLLLALEMENYCVIDLTVDIAGGKRQGKVQLVLPEVDKEEVVVDGVGAETEGRLERAAEVIVADLNAVIGQLRLPLVVFSSLTAGDFLPLHGLRLDRTELQTIDQKKVAVGRLGQRDGMRAVRLNETGTENRAVLPAARTFEKHNVSPAAENASRTDLDAPAIEHDGIAKEVNTPAKTEPNSGNGISGAI